MPDNPTNWSPDDDFWEDAWKDMSRQLDDHLPVGEQQRKPVLFWWFGGASLLLLLVAIGYVGYFAPQSSNAIEQSKEPLPHVQSEAIVTTPGNDEVIKAEPANNDNIASRSANSTLAENSQQTEENNSGFDAATKKQLVGVRPVGKDQLIAQNTLTTSRNQPTISNTRKSGVDVSRPYDSPDVQSFTSDFEEKNNHPAHTEQAKTNQNSLVITKEQSDIPAAPESNLSIEVVNNDKPATRVSKEAASIAGNQLLPIIYQQDLLLRKINSPDRKRNSFFLEGIVSHGTHSPGLGYGFDIEAERKFGRKHAINVSLGFRAQRQQFSFIPPIVEVADETIVSTPTNIADQQDSINTAYQELEDYLKNDSKDFISSYDARVGLGYTYDLNQKFSFGIEAGINFLVRGYAPSLVSLIRSTGEFSSTEEIDLIRGNGFGFAFDDLDQSYNIQAGSESTTNEYTTRRLRADLGLNVGYQLSSRWQISAGFRTFLQPVVESEIIELNPHRINVGLRFQIR